jgi:hypothetical protein
MATACVLLPAAICFMALIRRVAVEREADLSILEQDAFGLNEVNGESEYPTISPIPVTPYRFLESDFDHNFTTNFMQPKVGGLRPIHLLLLVET